MAIYIAKLQSSHDSSSAVASDYYATGASPYVGYVALSTGLPSSGNGSKYGIFNDTTIVKDYLGRSDNKGVISSDYALNLSNFYQSDLGLAGTSMQSKYFACSAVGKNIGQSDSNGFFYYTKINPDASSIKGKLYLPFSDENSNNNIILPFSNNSNSTSLYVNYVLTGMTKANTPFINLALFMQDCNHTNMSDELDISGIVGKRVGGANGVYEFPGYGGISTGWAELLFNAGVSGSFTSSAKVNACVNTANGQTAQRVLRAMAERIYEYQTLYAGMSYNQSTLNTYINNISYALSSIAIADGTNWYPVSLGSLTGGGSALNYESGGVTAGDGSYSQYADSYKITWIDPGNDYGGGSGMTRYKYYCTISIYTGYYTNTSSEFGTMFSTYKSLGEKLLVDHTAMNGKTAAAFRIDYTYQKGWTSGSYYMVARPGGHTISPNINDSRVTGYAEAICTRHQKYITRYDVAGLGNFYSSTSSSLHPKATSRGSVWYLDAPGISFFKDLLPDDAYVGIGSSSVVKSGIIYVDRIKLHFKGDPDVIRTSPNKKTIKDIEGNSKKVFPLNTGGGGTTGITISRDNYGVTYTISFGKTNTPSSIQTVDQTESNIEPIKHGMNIMMCGMHQLYRKNCNIYIGSSTTSYFDYLSSDSSCLTSQWTLARLTGVFSIQMSGRNVYSTTTDNSKDIVLSGVEVGVCDDTTVKASITKTQLSSVSTTLETNASKCLSVYSGTSQAVMKDAASPITYTSHNVFMNAIVGNKRCNQSASTSYDKYYYDNSGVLTSNWNTTSYSKYKTSVETSGSAGSLTPRVMIGGYGNTLPDNVYVGAAYKNAGECVNNISFDTVSSDPFVSSGTSSTSSNTYVKLSGHPIIGNNLNNLFKNTTQAVRFTLPKPDVKMKLIYDSVEFNGSSAWTFTRSMPLTAASAASPHVLVYKIEAWVETTDEYGNTIVDPDATSTIQVSAIDSKNSHRVYSGYSSITTEGKFGVNHAIESNEVLNNIYLKYRDGISDVYNAVSTKLPIKILDSSDAEGYLYYGGEVMNYTVKTVTYTADDKANISNMYSTIKQNISNDIQICLCSCAGGVSDINDGISMTIDNHKIFYFGIGFYNNREEFMPITASFGIDLSFTDSVTTETASYPKRISLNEFFPKDSMLYMAGSGATRVLNAKNKIKFIESNYAALQMSDVDLRKSSRDGSKTATAPKPHEVLNIGAGTDNSELHNYSGELHATSIRCSEDTVTGLYGIFNKTLGEVNYIATGSSYFQNTGFPDIVNAAENEGEDGAYKSYIQFINDYSGRCLTSSQNICLFEHCDEKDDIPYIL